MKRGKVRVPFKVQGKGGRRRNPFGENKVLVPTLDPPKRSARQPAIRSDDPERMHMMTRTEALSLFEPLPFPTSWAVYATAPQGDVASRMFGKARLLRAARLLYDMGTVDLAQRRTEAGTQYLIRRAGP